MINDVLGELSFEVVFKLHDWCFFLLVAGYCYRLKCLVMMIDMVTLVFMLVTCLQERDHVTWRGSSADMGGEQIFQFKYMIDRRLFLF